MMRLGEKLTLFCSSEISFDQYHLFRDGVAHGQWLSGGQRHRGAFQANFSVGRSMPVPGGTYRCYGSFNDSPYEWSAPSDPLQLYATGEERMPSACSGAHWITEPHLRGVPLGTQGY